MDAFDSLRAGLDGVAWRPGEAGYDEARQGVQRSYLHEPAVAVRPEGSADVRLAVRYAADQGLPVAVQATGHGLNVPTEGGVLLDTSRMTGVRVDPVARTAWVAAGTRWESVITAAGEHGLAPLSGSSPDVGVVGYTLSGGAGLLGRAFGYAADHVRRIELVTADGELRSVTRGDELFWALRGGGGAFGVVTGMEFDLFPVARFYGGGLYFDTALLPAALEAYRQWTVTVPATMCSSIGPIPLPDVPAVPAPLRGRHVAHIRIAYPGSVRDGERLVAPLRAVGPRIVDTLGEMPYTASGTIHNEPRQPRNFYCANAMLSDFAAAVPGAVLDLVGPGAGAFAVVQVNHLGAALARPPEAPNAVAHRDAAYVLRVVTLPGGASRDAAHETAEAVTRTAAPWTLGQSPNFIQGDRNASDRAPECYVPPLLARLAGLKARVDPDDMFRYAVTVPLTAASET